MFKQSTSISRTGQPENDAAEREPDGAAAGDGGAERSALQPRGADPPAGRSLDQGGPTKTKTPALRSKELDNPLRASEIFSSIV